MLPKRSGAPGGAATLGSRYRSSLSSNSSHPTANSLSPWHHVQLSVGPLPGRRVRTGYSPNSRQGSFSETPIHSLGCLCVRIGAKGGFLVWVEISTRDLATRLNGDSLLEPTLPAPLLQHRYSSRVPTTHLPVQYVFHYYSPCPRGGKRRCRQTHHRKRRRRRNRLHITSSPFLLIPGRLLLILQIIAHRCY